MSDSIHVLINAGAGLGARVGVESTVDAVRAALGEAGVAVEVEALEGRRLTGRASELAGAGAPMVVAAGGDGTVNAVAAALIGRRTAMGVLPLGTLNHFAKDLGLPLDLPAAAAVIARGRVSQVDVGAVNGRCFINNSSIGLYPTLVEDRER